MHMHSFLSVPFIPSREIESSERRSLNLFAEECFCRCHQIVVWLFEFNLTPHMEMLPCKQNGH